LGQGSGSFGGPLIKDKNLLLSSLRITRVRIERRSFRVRCPRSSCRRIGDLAYTGHYRQALVNTRLDHKLTQNQTLMFRFNYDGFSDDNPQDAVGGTSAPAWPAVTSGGR